MVTALRRHLSVLWICAGMLVALVIFGGVSAAVGALHQPQPIAVYPMREATTVEILRVIGQGIPQNGEVNGLAVDGPEGQIVTWQYAGDTARCIAGLRGSIDFAMCYPAGVTFTHALGVGEFVIDDAVVAEAKARGATDLLLVVNDERLEVWPIGPDLPMP